MTLMIECKADSASRMSRIGLGCEKSPMVKKFEGIGKPRLAATTSLFGLLGSQDEFLDPTQFR